MAKTTVRRGLWAASAVMALALTGCDGGGGGGSYHSDPFAQAWYDVYGYQCGSGAPRPGCNFYSNGSKIKDVNDPNFAYSYNLQYATYTYTDSYGYGRSYTGWAWWSPDNILYDDTGHALNEDGEDTSNSRDALAEASRQAEEVTQLTGKAFAKAQGLSEDTGIQIARDLQGWAQLGKSRARTSADIADFTQRLYGVDLSTAVAALSEAQATKSQAALEQINSRIATYWNTSPETSREILKGWYKSQLADYGVK